MLADIAVVGHVTWDTVHVHGEQYDQPGGVAYYAGVAAANLGASVFVSTSLAQADQPPLFREMEEAGVRIRARSSELTTTFVNRYPGGGQERVQNVLRQADTITVDDLSDVVPGTWHFGPLTPSDIEPECLEEARRRSGRVALDIQGLLRRLDGTRVKLTVHPRLDKYLRCADVVKMTEREACTVAKEEDLHQAAAYIAQTGPREVVVTRGSGGSLVYDSHEFVAVSGRDEDQTVDTTGCGDTYFVAYLLSRMRGRNVRESALFAAAAAAMKASRRGALRARSEEVDEFVRIHKLV